MKYFLLSLLLLLSADCAFSQEPDTYNPTPLQNWKKRALYDTLQRIYPQKSILISPHLNNSTMPILIIDNRGIYKGNTGNGRDLYSMKIDKMSCIVPDSTYKSTMPGTENLKKQKFLRPLPDAEQEY